MKMKVDEEFKTFEAAEKTLNTWRTLDGALPMDGCNKSLFRPVRPQTLA